MKDMVKIALAGIGGYGNNYVRRLLPGHAEGRFQFVAGIDAAPRKCQYLQELEENYIPIFSTMEQFYAQAAADLVIICAPIHWHAPLTCLALEHGSNVLCEKPVAATIQEAYAMKAAEDAAQRVVAIGFQWSFSDAIQQLKHDVLNAEFGRPLRLKTKVFWPRTQAYFRRSDWAGKLKAPNGNWVLDSIANNATAHYLHNMLYLLGSTRESSVWPVDVQAELYRANLIENYDTAAIRCHTIDGVEILFYAAHCVPVHQDPVALYEFEHADIEYSSTNECEFIARFHDGRCKRYGDPNATYYNKIQDSIDAVNTGAPVACGIQTAMPHIVCINGAQESMQTIMTFPAELIRRGEWQNEALIWVEGLQESLEDCYEQGVLPSEIPGIIWARPGDVIRVEDYRFFPSAGAECISDC